MTYPLYTPTGPVLRNPLTVACTASGTPPAPAQVCGNWAVNTMQPTNPPQGAFSQILPRADGARRSATASRPPALSWAWYSGGWANADGDVGDPGYTDGTAANPNTTSGCSSPTVDTGVRTGVAGGALAAVPGRALPVPPSAVRVLRELRPGTRRDGRTCRTRPTSRASSTASDKKCQLDDVSFVKPIGEENEHPGYASTPDGNTHLTEHAPRDRGQCVREGHDGDRHVRRVRRSVGSRVPAGAGQQQRPARRLGPRHADPGARDRAALKGDFVVDSTEHDTTSILATIEHRYGLAPLGSRDAAVGDMSSVFDAKKPKGVH